MGQPLNLVNDCEEGTWIIVPARNEAARIRETVTSLCGIYRNVVIVDDGSTDGTMRALSGLPVWCLRHWSNCGQGAALQTGIEFALREGAQVVVTFDADGQHVAEDIARLVDPIRLGIADVCLGSRFLGRAVGIQLSRWLILKAGVLLTRLFVGLKLTDTHNGLRALARSAATELHLEENRMAHATEILEQIVDRGWRYREVPVTIRYLPRDAEHGQSSWNAVRIGFGMLIRRINA
jgi:glycosyltransferase involved in cell wall biosynthesis